MSNSCSAVPCACRRGRPKPNAPRPQRDLESLPGSGLPGRRPGWTRTGENRRAAARTRARSGDSEARCIRYPTGLDLLSTTFPEVVEKGRGLRERLRASRTGDRLLAASLVEDGRDRPRLRQEDGARERWAGGYFREA